MTQSNFQELNYFTSENFPSFPSNFTFNQNNSPPLPYNHFSTNLPNFGINEFSPNSISSNSTSDEADDHQLRVIDERKQRRMISNRESARRSRMRKQRHLDELFSQVVHLRTENHSLMDKLNHVIESQNRAVQENARLKEEASDLRKMLSHLQISNSCTIFRDLDDISCNTAHLRAESANQSVTTSTNLLH